MLAALVVVVLVSATEASSAQTTGTALALEEALEAGSVVVVRATVGRPEDEDLAAVALAAHADAVATASWTSADAHVHLRVQRAGVSSAAERDIEFKRSDASVERGRTVGFALASMLPGVDPPPRIPAGGASRPPAKESPGTDESITRPAWGVDLAFAAAISLGESGGGLGGRVGLQRRLTPAIDARAALTVTRGSLSNAEAWTTQVRPRAGVGVLILRGRSVVVRARVDAGPWLQVVERAGTGRTSGTRWMAGTGAAAEVEWTVASSFALTFDLGLDVAFGTTRVVVGGEERAALAPVQAVGDVGVRFLF